MITFTQLKNLFGKRAPVVPVPVPAPQPARRQLPCVRLVRAAQVRSSGVILPAGTVGRILEYGAGFVFVSFPGVIARLPLDSQLIEGVE